MGRREEGERRRAKSHKKYAEGTTSGKLHHTIKAHNFRNNGGEKEKEREGEGKEKGKWEGGRRRNKRKEKEWLTSEGKVA
jgi:hypothetical protein